MVECFSNTKTIRKFNVKNIFKIIPLINDDGILDDSKLDDEYKKNLLLKALAEESFLKDE